MEIAFYSDQSEALDRYRRDQGRSEPRSACCPCQLHKGQSSPECVICYGATGCNSFLPLLCLFISLPLPVSPSSLLSLSLIPSVSFLLPFLLLSFCLPPSSSPSATSSSLLKKNTFYCTIIIDSTERCKNSTHLPTDPSLSFPQ